METFNKHHSITNNWLMVQLFSAVGKTVQNFLASTSSSMGSPVRWAQVKVSDNSSPWTLALEKTIDSIGGTLTGYEI